MVLCVRATSVACNVAYTKRIYTRNLVEGALVWVCKRMVRSQYIEYRCEGRGISCCGLLNLFFTLFTQNKNWGPTKYPLSFDFI